jgi:hypothetical protein
MLHTALSTAPDRPMFHIAAGLAAVALSGAALAFAAGAIPEPDANANIQAASGAPGPEVTEVAEVDVPKEPIAEPEAAAEPAEHGQLMFVFHAGGATYMRLSDLIDRDEHDEPIAMPHHGKPKLSTDKTDYTVAAVAAVADLDVPEELRSWRGRKVEVDATCQATVVGFAVVSRLVGDPGYDGQTRWTASRVMRSGHAVLAARLDRCIGSFARDASLPGIAVPAVRHDEALEAAARHALLDSAASQATQETWEEQVRGSFAAAPAPAAAPKAAIGHWYDKAELTSEVLQHPRTGETFVSVHGRLDHDCGGPEANVWGLFRVKADGTLAEVQVRPLGEVETIDALVDLDGDGRLYVLGRPWLGFDRMLTRPDGEVLQQLPVPLFGCPC